jgi:hypothetical protein
MWNDELGVEGGSAEFHVPSFGLQAPDCDGLESQREEARGAKLRHLSRTQGGNHWTNFALGDCLDVIEVYRLTSPRCITRPTPDLLPRR